MKSKKTNRTIRKKVAYPKRAIRSAVRTLRKGSAEEAAAAAFNTLLLMTVVSALILSFAMYSLSIFYFLWR
jgi:hypothetical protein